MVSIIIPIYKVETWLKYCLDSLINQTYSEIEVILVNDGSPDNCGQICDEYAAIDPRFKVIHKDNGGLSDARNAGMAIAQGEYITFIDSDDYVAPNYVERLLNLLLKHDADISQCDFHQFNDDEENSCAKIASNEHEITVMSGLSSLEALWLYNSHVSVITCAKLYRKHLFTENDIIFPKGRIHEDEFTTYKLLYYSRLVAFTNDKLYFYRQRRDSIMGSPFSAKRLDAVTAVASAIDFAKQNNMPLLNEAMHYYVRVNFALIDCIFQSSGYHGDFMAELKQLRRNVLSSPGIFTYRHYPMRERIHFMLLALGYWIYAPLRVCAKIIKRK